MNRVLRRAIVVLAIVAASISPASVGAASANTAADAAIIRCAFIPPIYLNTAFGPVAMCTRLASTPAGLYGQAGHFSGITEGFSPTTGWLKVTANDSDGGQVRATDNFVGFVGGGPLLNTAVGPARYGTQLGNGRHARFGVWNTYLNVFYPSSGWLSY